MGKPKENSLSGDQVLMNLWNEERNQAMKPSFFTRGSNKKVWWRCTKGHEWQALISSVAAGNRCPYCANRKVLAGYNDLKTMSPHLAREWHPFKNRDLSSTEVTAGSNKRVWWKCARGHEWRAVIAQRKRVAVRIVPEKSSGKWTWNLRSASITRLERRSILRKTIKKPASENNPDAGFTLTWYKELKLLTHSLFQCVSKSAVAFLIRLRLKLLGSTLTRT